MARFNLITLLSMSLLLMSLNLTAQTQHNVMIWGSGGYNSLMTSAPKIDYSGNIGGGVGVGYEFKFKRFMVHTGAEFNYLTSDLNLHTFKREMNLVDADNVSYTAHYTFEKNTDHYSMGYLNIPLMAGFQFGRIYFLVGGKLGFNLFGTSKTETNINKTISYPQLNYEESAGNFTETSSYPTKFKLNYGASAEVGAYLGKYKSKTGHVKRTQFRLAAFCDYGFANIHPQDPIEELVLNKADEFYYQPTLNSFVLAPEMEKQAINTLFLGLKFTVLINVLDTSKCQCDAYNF